jgi:arabinan endo-1,5-alpha-L-arabinosidase
MGAHRSEIGVATSPSLEMGSWTDHGAIGLPQNARYNLIDPYVFQADKDSPMYMTFGSFWSGIQQLELSSHEQLMSWAGTEQDIHNIISNTTERYAVQEGAIMYKNNDLFYIFFSVGQCCNALKDLVPAGDEYHVVVCRADNITGPYFDKDGKDCLKDNGGTTILESHNNVYAPGGQGVMLDPKTSRTVMYYHYSMFITKPGIGTEWQLTHETVKTTKGYAYEDFLFGFNYLDWVDDWPVVV